jgi:hypothetical protein
MSILDKSPFPFDQNGRELQRVMAGIYPDHNDAMSLAGPLGVDPLEIPIELAPLDLWRELLKRLAKLGSLRAAVKAAISQFPHNPNVPYLKNLLAEPEGDPAHAFEAQPERDPARAFDRVQQAGASLFGSVISYPSTQTKFFTGLAVFLAAIVLLFFLIPDDELAIKLLYDGTTARFVNVRYDLKEPPPGGLNYQELGPGGDGFIRIAHRKIAEPPTVSLKINEALLPPVFTGNDKNVMLRVDKLNYEEVGFPFWYKTRHLFLDVKVEFVAGK